MAGWRRIALPLGCCLGLSLWLGSTPAELASGDQTRSEQLLAVPVEDGQASFELPHLHARDQFLIIVSSLSRQSGPFPVEVTTEPLGTAREDEIESFEPPPRHAALLVASLSDGHPLAPVEWRMNVARLDRLRDRREQIHNSRRDTAPYEPPTPLPSPPVERTFWLMVRGDDYSDAKNYQAVRARLAATGEHCAVYVDADDLDAARGGIEGGRTRERLAKSLAPEVLATFDRDVYPTAQRTLGRHRDVDGDGRFTILFTHWLGKLSGGTVSVGGFVRGGDFDPHLQPPLGNRCDMMYLNSDLEPGPHLRTLIAHEYTHAITFSEHVFGRFLPDDAAHEEESWLDEAIAHLAENQHGYSWSNLDYRISGFLNAPERYRLVVEDYYAANLWRGHGNRGSTYLFLRWCVDQFGEEILKDLVQTNLCGVENVETVTGRSFPELYRAWSAAVFLSQSGLDDRPQERLRFVNLRAALGSRLLAGPRYEYMDLGGHSAQFTLAGTSTKYFIAHSPGAVGSRIRIAAQPDAELQVSVRRLPDAVARLEMTAARSDPDAAGSAPLPFRVRLTEHNGVPVTLEHVQWETVAPGSNKEAERGFVSRLLSSSEIESLLGCSVVPAGGTITLCSLPIESPALGTESLVLKVSGRDASGHAVTAWCTLERVRADERRQIADQHGEPGPEVVATRR